MRGRTLAAVLVVVSMALAGAGWWRAAERGREVERLQAQFEGMPDAPIVITPHACRYALDLAEQVIDREDKLGFPIGDYEVNQRIVDFTLYRDRCLDGGP